MARAASSTGSAALWIRSPASWPNKHPDPVKIRDLRDGVNDPVLRLEDCVAGMATLAAGSVDVAVTSPPYNLGIAYGEHDDSGGREDYLAWCDTWAAGVRRALSPEGSFFLNIGGKPKDPLVPFQVLEVMLRHFRLQNTIHWVKSIAVMREDVGNYPGLHTDLVVGHYKPINSRRFVNDCHEYVFHLTHRGDVPLERLAVGVPYRDKSNVTRWKGAGADVHCRGNTWFLPYETIQRRDRDRPHPATFPIALPERCIRLHGVERARLVLDPFLGIGTTAVACVRLGVPFVGFEIDPAYLAHARERVAAALEAHDSPAG
jgi:site-specific DNA-methyltransferase (adenine-specific)